MTSTYYHGLRLLDPWVLENRDKFTRKNEEGNFFLWKLELMTCVYLEFLCEISVPHCIFSLVSFTNENNVKQFFVLTPIKWTLLTSIEIVGSSNHAGYIVNSSDVCQISLQTALSFFFFFFFFWSVFDVLMSKWEEQGLRQFAMTVYSVALFIVTCVYISTICKVRWLF